MPPTSTPSELPLPPPATASARRHRYAASLWALGVFALALAWISTLAWTTVASGAHEEHFAVGRRLYATGSLAAPNDPGILRPPGYPAFVAATLLCRDALAPWVDAPREEPRSSATAMLVAQCLVLALATTVAFAFGTLALPPLEAACVSLVFACGPISLSLVGLHSYHLLHVLGLVVGTAQLAFAAGRQNSTSPFHPLLAGVLWGLTSLVRPVSLILPPFVFLLARVRRGGTGRSAALFTLLFTGGMAAAILPYAARNYRVSGRFVLVNAQGWFALWASTERTARPGEAFLSWRSLWRERGLSIYREVTGHPKYDLTTFNGHIFELEAAFKREALSNLTRQPGVYLRNAAANLWRFGREPMVKWPDHFAVRNDLSRARTRFLLRTYSTGLLLLAVPGIAVGVYRRCAIAWTLLLVLCALAAAHAFTFLNERYTYVKSPLLVMALALTLTALGDRSIGLGWIRLRMATALAGATLAGSAAATLWLLAP